MSDLEMAIALNEANEVMTGIIRAIFPHIDSALFEKWANAHASINEVCTELIKRAEGF